MPDKITKQFAPEFQEPEKPVKPIRPRVGELQYLNLKRLLDEDIQEPGFITDAVVQSALVSIDGWQNLYPVDKIEQKTLQAATETLTKLLSRQDAGQHRLETFKAAIMEAVNIIEPHWQEISELSEAPAVVKPQGAPEEEKQIAAVRQNIAHSTPVEGTRAIKELEYLKMTEAEFLHQLSMANSVVGEAVTNVLDRLRSHRFDKMRWNVIPISRKQRWNKLMDRFEESRVELESCVGHFYFPKATTVKAKSLRELDHNVHRLELVVEDARRSTLAIIQQKEADSNFDATNPDHVTCYADYYFTELVLGKIKGFQADSKY